VKKISCLVNKTLAHATIPSFHFHDYNELIMSQVAAKLQPYLNYIMLVQLLLIAFAAFIGLLIIFKRFRSRSVPVDLGNDAEAIAMEITHEIGRLDKLRQRLSSKAKSYISPSTKADSRLASDLFSEPTVSSDAQTIEGEAASLSAQGQVDVKSVEQQIEARYLDSIEQLKNKIEDLNKSNEVLKAQASSGGGIQNDAVEIQGQATIHEAIEVRNKLEKENEEIQEKLVHLEKVISEYQLFEEDFALVKRYKAENERLKKQLTDVHQVTEDDINNLFSAVEGSEATGVTQKESVEVANSDDFLTSEFSSNQAIPATSIPQATEGLVAQEGAVNPGTTVSAIAEGAIVKEAEPAATEAETKTETESIQSAASEVSGPGLISEDDISNLLAGVVNSDQSEKSQEPPVQVAPSSSTPDKVAPISQKVEEEKVRQEPVFGSGPSADDFEALAEAAGDDDALLAEFQKVLGGKS